MGDVFGPPPRPVGRTLSTSLWGMRGRGVAQGGWGGSFGEEQGSGIPLGPVL